MHLIVEPEFLFKATFQLKKKPPYFKITSVSPHTEGPGSQALNVIHAINLATILKVPYVHTEFQTLAHADRPMSEWAQLWEQHFNLGMSETKFDDQDPEVINFAIIMHHVRYFFDIRDFKPAFNHTLPVFKKRYFQNKRKLKKNTATVNIAIHVRRGDITPKHTKMWTPVESLFVTIQQLVQSLEARQLKYELNLFSQGDASDFDLLG